MTTETAFTKWYYWRITAMVTKELAHMEKHGIGQQLSEKERIELAVQRISKDFENVGGYFRGVINK